MSAIAFFTRALVFCQGLGAEFVELGRWAGFAGAVLLDEVEASERDV